MSKFSELLDEYLDLRDRDRSDYYENRWLGEGRKDSSRMQDLREMMDNMIENRFGEKE